MSTQARTDQNLLFGILALQMDFIGRDALLKAMHAWVLDKTKPLGQILFEQGVLSAERRTLLEALVAEHLKLHGNDVEKSLASVSSLGSVRQDLQDIADADIQASLAHVSIARQAEEEEDLYPTRPPTVGVPTSAGTRFRILRPHAKGGLGEVFVAHDEELHREVALKEIQDRYADHQHNRTRFVLEAEITGGLEHPGIVPVYGLGQYADGRPFYAMRFIKGDSLQEAIQRFHAAERPRRALALRDLLGRFVDVCNAIAYAHARGVLHRDLKPGNVVLGKYGETLVVDWGLAKAAGGKENEGQAEEVALKPLSASDSAPTQLGTAIGTPAYMSPEQAAGRLDLLGPASDIYSLGATLYCLLTGKPAFQGQEVGEVLKAVQRGEFPPPRRVKREVPAALEAICLKAMALRPEARYSSAKALAEDVEHWLADEPVSAYREPWRVRAGRWARRHQTLVAAMAAALLVALLAGGAGAWWLERQQTEQRRSVESTLREVEWLQWQGRWSEARAVLGQAKERLGQNGPRDLQERLDRGERNLNLVARLDALRLKRATIIEGNFDYKGADREYEEAFREAGMIEVNGDAAAAAAWVHASAVQDALLAALDDWAFCLDKGQRRNWLLSVARMADTDPWRKQVRDPAIWEDKAALVRLTTAKELSEQAPQFLVALAFQVQALRGDPGPLLRMARGLHPGDFWANVELGNTLANKKPADAVGYYLSALAVRPGTPGVHYNLGNVLDNMGRREEAVAEYRKAIELGPKFAQAHNNLGVVLKDMGRREEAAAEYRKAIELGPQYATAHNNLGVVLKDMGRREEAVVEYRKASKLDPKYASPHHNLGNVLHDMGRRAEAVVEYRKASELDPKNALTHYNLGIVLFNMGRQEEAAAELRKAIELDPNSAQAHNNLGNALLTLGRREEAASEFRKAAAEYRKAIERDPQCAPVHGFLGQTLLHLGQFSEARQATQRCLKLLRITGPLRQQATQQLQECEQMIALDEKLTAILEGTARPANAAEQMALVELCQIKRHYLAAARLSSDAFAAEPKLADDLPAGHRYNAACYAALAAAGQGEDAAKLTDKERARLRKQALDWLRADLALWSKQIEKGTPQECAAAQKTLRHWLQDADLAGIRDAAALDKLPEVERAEWRKLWNEVGALLKK